MNDKKSFVETQNADGFIKFELSEKDSQSRKYQITINNPLDIKIEDEEVSGVMIKTPFTHEKIRKQLSALRSVQYWCMADEIGLKGETPHTHIYLVACAPIRFSTVKRLFPTAHIEAAYGDSKANRDYIAKEGKWKNTTKYETSVNGTFEEWGEIPVNERMGMQGRIQFLYNMIADGMSTSDILKVFPEAMLYVDKIDKTRQIIIEDKYKDTWRNLEVIYIYGETGTGKTRSIMEKYGYRHVHRITDYLHPWDGYQSTRHQVIVFDEFRSSLKIQDMLDYLDGYPCDLGARYYNRVATYSKVYLISNIPLEEQYQSVQKESSVTWDAFLRRIHRVNIYHSDGTIDTYNSVKEYMERNCNFRKITEEEQIALPFN